MKHIIKLVFLLTVYATLLLSCQEKEETISFTYVNSKVLRSTDKIADSIYYATVMNIRKQSDYIMASDGKSILFLNEELELKDYLNIFGEGPSEIYGISDFYFFENQLLVYEAGRRKFKSFGSNHNLTVIFDLDRDLPSLSFDRFAFDQVNRNIIIAGEQYHEYNIDKKLVNLDIDHNDYGGMKSMFLIDSETYIALDRVSTKIDIIKGGIIAKTYDLGFIPYIKQTFDNINFQGKKPNGNFSLIQNAYFHNGKLYLLTAKTGGKEGYWVNKIIALDPLNPKNIEIISLEDRIYNSFAVIDDDKLCVFNYSRSSFQIIEIIR